jgi:hypothetical protein
MIFLAHHLATWIGVPAGVLIAGAFILRKKGMAAMKARRQAKESAPQLQVDR